MLNEFEKAYESALITQAKMRNQQVTAFSRKVADSVFTAALLAIKDNQFDEASYRVVSAPTGSGKSSCAQALIGAYVKVFPDASVLFLVETVRQADELYLDMRGLLGEATVAVWTNAHDKFTSNEIVERNNGFVPEHRFSVEDLGLYPVVIVTQRFYIGSRGRSALLFQGAPRKLTFIDERMSEVTLYDVDTGLIKTARDRIAEKHTSTIEHVSQLTRLHDHMESLWQSAGSLSAYNSAAPNDDLSWFTTDQAKNYIASSDPDVRNAFGFGRALARGCAFLSRYDKDSKGGRFVGYELAVSPRPGTILLDATADIDGVSLIAANRKPVAVPRVDFKNLLITHIDPPDTTARTIKSLLRTAKSARGYAQWIVRTIAENTHSGEEVLAVVHKGLLDHDYLPNNNRKFDAAFDLDGRKICIIHWGSGIGSNAWKTATSVFLFGEFHIPKRTTIATCLGLKDVEATTASLAPFQSPNSQSVEFLALAEGHVLRWLKQLAMRGNARNIDENGVCGRQRLYITGEFLRLVQHKDRMFPGAKLAIRHGADAQKRRGAEALAYLLYDHSGNYLSVQDVRRSTGVDLQKNARRYLSSPIVQRAMDDRLWSFVPGKGRGNVGRFIRSIAQAA